MFKKLILEPGVLFCSVNLFQLCILPKSNLKNDLFALWFQGDGVSIILRTTQFRDRIRIREKNHHTSHRGQSVSKMWDKATTSKANVKWHTLFNKTPPAECFVTSPKRCHQLEIQCSNMQVYVRHFLLKLQHVCIHMELIKYKIVGFHEGFPNIISIG